MWITVVLLALGLGYVLYRLSFSIRAAQADRTGNGERAEALRTKGSVVFLGAASALMLVVIVAVAVLIATR